MMTRVPAERIVALAQSGKFTTQKCIADHVGLSRERVRQVLAERGVRFGKQRGAPLSWPCPDCGETIIRPYGSRNSWSHMPAHCRRCAWKYCLRGHLRLVNITKWGACRLCIRMTKNRIVRYRVCVDCEKRIPVTDQSDRQAKWHGYKLLRCRHCQGVRALPNARKTHCKRGHPLSGDNLYVYDKPGKAIKRQCRECNRRRRAAS